MSTIPTLIAASTKDRAVNLKTNENIEMSELLSGSRCESISPKMKIEDTNSESELRFEDSANGDGGGEDHLFTTNQCDEEDLFTSKHSSNGIETKAENKCGDGEVCCPNGDAGMDSSSNDTSDQGTANCTTTPTCPPPPPPLPGGNRGETVEITGCQSHNDNFNEPVKTVAAVVSNGVAAKSGHTTSSATLSTPFPLLSGEVLYYHEKINEGTLYLTNYRLYVNPNKFTYCQLNCSYEQQELDQLINLPLNCIDWVEYRDLYFLVIFTKYIQSFNLSFHNAETASLWFKRLIDVQNIKTEDLFCFQFYANLPKQLRNRINSDLLSINSEQIEIFRDSYRFVVEEFKRMKFDTTNWRICDLNKEFKFCNSYPQYFIVPDEMSDKDLECIANFRYSHRIPVVVWRSRTNGCVIIRSSQPVVGWLGWRNNQDERLLQRILKICNSDTQSYNETSKNCLVKNGTVAGKPLLESNGFANKHTVVEAHSENNSDQSDTQDEESDTPVTNGTIALDGKVNGNCSVVPPPPSSSSSSSSSSSDSGNKLLILDARSYTAAFANRAMGGGSECPEYYANCDVQFMGLNNIHNIRKSFIALRYICEAVQIDQPNWFTLLDNTKWFHNLASLLKAAVVVVDTISSHARPVLVHCSDGWDRTPQVVALAELMLDPYYRTIDGFKVLIEREWLQFGHKFADRCRSAALNIDPNERCPVFLQWLDCVHQLYRQFPSEFEFNTNFLIKLVYHSNSYLYGNFACNNVQERTTYNIYEKTISIWSYFKLKRQTFINYLYNPKKEILKPSYRVKDIVFWNEVYVPVSNTCLSELIPHSSTLIGRKNCQKRNCAAAANSLLNSDEEDDEIDYKHHLSQSKLDFTRSLEDIAKECVGVVAGGSAGGGGGKELSNEYDSNILKTNLFKTSSLSNLLQLNCDSPLNGKLPTEQVMASGEHEPTKLSDCNGDFDRRHEEEEEEETTQGLQSNTDNRKEVNEHNGNDSIGDCDDDDNGSGSSTDELEQQPDCKPLFDRNQNELYDIDGLLIQNGNLPDSQNQIKQRIVYHKQMINLLVAHLKSIKKI